MLISVGSDWVAPNLSLILMVRRCRCVPVGNLMLRAEKPPSAGRLSTPTSAIALPRPKTRYPSPAKTQTVPIAGVAISAGMNMAAVQAVARDAALAYSRDSCATSADLIPSRSLRMPDVAPAVPRVRRRLHRIELIRACHGDGIAVGSDHAR